MAERDWQRNAAYFIAVKRRSQGHHTPKTTSDLLLGHTISFLLKVLKPPKIAQATLTKNSKHKPARDI